MQMEGFSRVRNVEGNDAWSGKDYQRESLNSSWNDDSSCPNYEESSGTEYLVISGGM